MFVGLSNVYFELFNCSTQSSEPIRSRPIINGNGLILVVKQQPYRLILTHNHTTTLTSNGGITVRHQDKILSQAHEIDIILPQVIHIE